MFCPKCGKEFNEECAFCSGCGYSFKGEQTQTLEYEQVKNTTSKFGLYDKTKEILRSTSDFNFYASLPKLQLFLLIPLSIGLFLILLILFTCPYDEVQFGNTYVSVTKMLSFLIPMAFAFVPIAIVCGVMIKKISDVTKICITVAQKNNVVVFEDRIEGCTCQLQLSEMSNFKTFSIPLDEIVRVQMERERCEIKFDNPIIDVLSIYTEQKKYQIWAISDVPVLANNINNLLKK